MKKSLAIILLFAAVATQAQVTPYLKITLDRKLMKGFCDLGQGSASPVDTVYLHSGLGTTSTSAVWEHVVGNWGQANGKGRMLNEGNGVFSLTVNIADYYTNLASPDSNQVGGEGIGPMPNGATPYNIGLVFREEGPCPVDPLTGDINCREGKDTLCRDIFVVDLPSGAPYVLDQAGGEFAPVTVQYVQGTNVNDMFNKLSASVYPNPFVRVAEIDFEMKESKDLTIEVSDIMGRTVTTLFNGKSVSGKNHITWDALNCEKGVYFINFVSGKERYSTRIVKN